MNQPDRNKPDRKQNVVNMALAIVAGQVGCLTLVIVLAAVLGGIWLDNHFNSRPTFTIALVLVSIPVSVIAMLVFVRAAVRRMTVSNKQDSQNQREETNIGKHS